MHYIDFLSGFYSALCLSIGVFFLMSRKRRAPFREAYGWMSLYCSIENIMFYVLNNSISTDFLTQKTVCACADMTTVPFISFVIVTIVNQDMKTTPFSKRWRHIVILEIPIIVCMGICAFSNVHFKELLAGVMTLIYIATLLIYSAYSLHKYEKRLPNDTKGKEASIKWSWYLVGLLAIEAVLYLCIGTYITDISYYVVLCAVMCIATNYINKQSPIDTRQLFSAAITTEEESNSSNEIDNKSASPSRKDMKAIAKEFVEAHPKFSERVAERATQKLTVRDIFLCIMIIEGKRVSEISETLGISPSSVEVARYRLRTKLSLNKGENLAKVLKDCL